MFGAARPGGVPSLGLVHQPVEHPHVRGSVASFAATIRRGPPKSAMSAARRVAPPVSPSLTNRIKSGV
jgi:hypothetical protein